jgi:hypothetical protein
MSLGKQLAAGPTAVLNGIKQQANLSANGGVRSADLEQVNLNNMIWKTADRERGFASFFSTGPATAEFKGD